jgi:hypothetical protein
MPSATFVIPTNYEEDFNKNINHFKNMVDKMNKTKELITKYDAYPKKHKMNIQVKDRTKDIILVNNLINHNHNMMKMYKLEKMLFKMLVSPPKDNFDKIVSNMREKFYEASSNAMDSYKEMVDIGFKKEGTYIELCNQFKQRMEQYTDMCETIKENGANYRVETR